MLTDRQRAHFDVFGFLVFRQAFSPEETARISSTFDRVLEEDRQGRPFEGHKRQAVTGFVEREEELTRLLEDDRIYPVIEQLLGPGFVWIGSDGNLYVGDTGWHPDGRHLEHQAYRWIKVAFYLDPVRRDTGCLRVIPGSHRGTLHQALKERWPKSDAAESPYGISGAEVPAFPLESDPGDVVLFDQSLWHASFGGRTGRRMFTLNFGAKPQAEADYENLRSTHAKNLGFIADMQYTQTGRVYTDAFLESGSPRIRSMVAELLEMGLK